VHLPLTVPRRCPSTLTPWLHLSFNLQSLIPLFNTLALRQRAAEEGSSAGDRKKRKVAAARVPTGRLGSVSHVRVYANCRVRRVWFVSRFPSLARRPVLTVEAEDGERSLESLGRAGREEWGLYAAEAVC
jgi:hypothetical protein